MRAFTKKQTLIQFPNKSQGSYVDRFLKTNIPEIYWSEDEICTEVTNDTLL